MYSVHSIFSVRDFGIPILPRVGWLSLRTRYSFVVVSALIREIRHSGRSVSVTECDAVARNMGLNVADCAIVVSLKRGLLPASFISRAVVPIRPAEPVPAIQVRRASIRPRPEITAHPISPFKRGSNIYIISSRGDPLLGLRPNSPPEDVENQSPAPKFQFVQPSQAQQYKQEEPAADPDQRSPRCRYSRVPV